MCLAKAYSDREEKVLLEDVAFLKVEGGKVRLWTLFGEERELQGSVKEVDFQSSKILLKSLSEE